MKTPNKQQKMRRRLWGRAKGKALSAHQARLIENLLPKTAIDIDAPLNALSDYNSIRLEIGFGGAEHLLHRARQNPDMGFIGVEPFINGVAKALVGIDKHGLDNIRLHAGDVWDFIENIPDTSLDHIDILYPDPWPKKRHYKRRLIRSDLILQMHRILKPNGTLYFASDIPSYVNWALERILRFEAVDGGRFNWRAESASDWLTPFDGWIETRFEARALRDGRTPHYFRFNKTRI